MSRLFENEWVWIEAETSEIPWLKIFAKGEHKEFSECDAATRAEIWRLLDLIEREMLACYRPDKINIASFANYLPKVHWHIMARFRDDSYFPEPVWGKKQREGKLDLLPVEDFLQSIRDKL
ncbi:MAG: HIT family protein [Gammaproteobacteria bacterium]|nr:HIT family protein [Gammaproteobacteria bacterium]